MDKNKRLWENLDNLDKSIARTSLVLLSVSLLYLALYYNLTDSFSIPLLNIKLSPKYAFYVGTPIIFLIFHYLTAAGAATLVLECALSENSESTATNNYLFRYPTFFTILWVSPQLKAKSLRPLIFVPQLILIVASYHLLPVVSCAHVLLWIHRHGNNYWVTILALVLTALCLVEALVSSIAFAYRTMEVISNSAVSRPS